MVPVSIILYGSFILKNIALCFGVIFPISICLQWYVCQYQFYLYNGGDMYFGVTIILIIDAVVLWFYSLARVVCLSIYFVHTYYMFSG